MSKPDGGPFGAGFSDTIVRGMTLRDIFALKMIPLSFKIACEEWGYGLEKASKETARTVYAYADAMIAERDK